MPLACDWTPGPGYYETRKSLENDILNRIMYSAKSDVFINK